MDDRSAKINIGGREFELILTTRATKEIAGRYGGLENLGQKLMRSENFEMALDELVWLITLLANQSVLIHNLRTPEDKQALLLETLRVLKKGGTFAIHDLMSSGRYGDMLAFAQKLRDMGYERVELIDTTDGSFMTPKEAKRLMLRGSTLLVGRK